MNQRREGITLQHTIPPEAVQRAFGSDRRAAVSLNMTANDSKRQVGRPFGLPDPRGVLCESASRAGFEFHHGRRNGYSVTGRAEMLAPRAASPFSHHTIIKTIGQARPQPAGNWAGGPQPSKGVNREYEII